MTIRKKYPADFKAKVVLEIIREEKSISQISLEYGIHSTQLNHWKKQAIEGMPQLFADERKNFETVKAGYEKEINDLYAKIGQLTTQLDWLKKNLASKLTNNDRKALIEWNNPELPIATQAELLSLNRTGLYYKPVQLSAEEIAIKHRIDEIYTAYPFYGSRRITAQLCRDGFYINRKAVQRHMWEMGIAGICPGPNLSKRRMEHQVFPYLLRGVTASYPNHVWGVDITYIRLVQGWMYLVAVLD